MDWELFVNSLIQLIHYTAWPLTILVLVLIFRKAILRSLGQLKKMSVGDKIALEFLPLEIQKRMAEKVKFEEIAKDSFTWKHYLDALENWMEWVAICAGHMILLRLKGRSGKGHQEQLKNTIYEYNKIAKKIERERSDSKVLKNMSVFMDGMITDLKSYESTIPKPHWSDDL